MFDFVSPEMFPSILVSNVDILFKVLKFCHQSSEQGIQICPPSMVYLEIMTGRTVEIPYISHHTALWRGS
jgi:hypothetical protein